MSDFMDALSETVQDTSDSLGSHLHGFGDLAEIYSAGQARQQTQALGTLALQQQELIRSKTQTIELSREDLRIQKDQLSQLNKLSESLRQLLAHLDSLERRREREYERDAKCPACHTRLSSTPAVCPCCTKSLQWQSFNIDTEGIIWEEFVERIQEHARNTDFTVLNLSSMVAVPVLSEDSPIRDEIAHALYNSKHHYKLVNEKAAKQRLEDELNLYWIQHQLNSHDCLCECCGYLFQADVTKSKTTCNGCHEFVESCFESRTGWLASKKEKIEPLTLREIKKSGKLEKEVAAAGAALITGTVFTLGAATIGFLLTAVANDVFTASVLGGVFFVFGLMITLAIRSMKVAKLNDMLLPHLKEEAQERRLDEYKNRIEELSNQRMEWVREHGTRFSHNRPRTWFPQDISGLPNERWFLDPAEFGECSELYFSSRASLDKSESGTPDSDSGKQI